jgi:parallel beta-helix repeat protein
MNKTSNEGTIPAMSSGMTRQKLDHSSFFFDLPVPLFATLHKLLLSLEESVYHFGRLSLTFCLSLALLLVAASQCATAATVTLNPCNCGDDSVQINQATITATRNGTVPGTLVFNGTFDLSITPVEVRVPNLTLLGGAQGGTLDASTQRLGYGIRLNEGSSGLTVRGLTIRARFKGVASRLSPPVLTPLTNVTITGNTVTAAFHAIEDFTAGGSANWTVTNNVIRCPVDPLTLCDADIFVASSNSLIQGNDIVSASDGITVVNEEGFFNLLAPVGGNNNLIANNTIHAPDAIFITGGVGNLVKDNTIFTTLSDLAIADGVVCIGIGVSGQPPVELAPGFTPVVAQGNSLLSNTINASCGVGIQLEGETDLTRVARNVISSATGVNGIEIGPDPFGFFGQALSTNASVRKNTITGGAIGIHIFPQAANNTVTNNNVSRSVPAPATPVLVDTSSNTNTVRNN